MDKKKEWLSKIAYICFYLAVLIETLIVIVDKSILINPWEGRLFQITFVLCLVKVCLTKYTPGEYLMIAVFLGLGAVSYFVTGRNEIVRVVMFIAACKAVDMKKCMKLVFYLTLTGCLLIIGLSLTGIGGAAVLTQNYGRGSIESRYALGMGHPNAFHCMVWALILLFMYVYAERLRWYHYIVLFLINGMAFLLSDSKASFLITTITLLGGCMLQYLAVFRKSKIVEGLGLIAFAGCIGISVIGAANAALIREYYWSRDLSAKAEFYAYLDKFLTGRLQTLACTTNYEGTLQTWRLFSNAQSTYYFDLGWVRLFYWFGIIPAVIYILANLILLHVCYQKEDYTGFLMVLSIALYTIIEAHVISDYIARNYVFFLLGAYWYRILPGTLSQTGIKKGKINVKSIDGE